MDAGRLRNMITLQRKSATKDAMGGEVISWIDVATVFADAAPIRGQEFMVLQASAAEIDVRFTIYFREDVDSTWRVKWRDRQYDIVAPPIDVRGNRVWTELMCRTAQT